MRGWSLWKGVVAIGDGPHKSLTKAAEKILETFNTNVEPSRAHDRELYMLLLQPTFNSGCSIKKLERALQVDTMFRTANAAGQNESGRTLSSPHVRRVSLRATRAATAAPMPAGCAD